MNVVPEAAFVEGEVRGENTELLEYMDDRAREVLRGAGTMHGCDVTIDQDGWAPSARSDDDLGGSEDATFLMREVQNNGGTAAYVGIGTDHPGGHHTPHFDVDEESIRIGIEVLAEAIERLGSDQVDTTHGVE